tara:strand:+ start:19 stop:678 length:660 start_codon:yes stop_codon:yes gene_type:complete
MQSSNINTGFFLTIEGADGAGKTTHCSLLSEALNEIGLEVVSVREPGGTIVGEKIRKIVKGSEKISPLTELLLFQAARSELVEKVISPAIKNNKVVIADRFIDSTLAYQGFGRGINLKDIDAINEISTKKTTPNLSILLDLPTKISIGRSRTRDSLYKNNERRFENEPDDFHEKVIKGFKYLANKNSERWETINSNRDIKIVAKEIYDLVIKKINSNNI